MDELIQTSPSSCPTSLVSSSESLRAGRLLKQLAGLQLLVSAGGKAGLACFSPRLERRLPARKEKKREKKGF